jgi:hypothetical protein
MTDQVPPTYSEDADVDLGDPVDEGVDQPVERTETVGAEPTTTGVPEVDAALAQLDGVESLPLEQQLAAFERAHEGLRSALDSRPSERPGEPA